MTEAESDLRINTAERNLEERMDELEKLMKGMEEKLDELLDIANHQRMGRLVS